MLLLDSMDWELILELFEMETTGMYFNTELSIAREKMVSGDQIFLDSF